MGRGVRGPTTFVGAGFTRFGHLDQPLAEVAHVDDLHGVGSVPGCQDLAAAMDAHGPVGETVGGVARADDQSGPEDQRPVVAERVPGVLLGQGFC